MLLLRPFWSSPVVLCEANVQNPEKGMDTSLHWYGQLV